ncbi:MAG: pyridoxal phosphate-dependent aminotransferase [Planctomycetaceae bacterium]|nr:pyridoxal phosphate-dependent aminotransferase [Planctomycetaceae bacterium]
MESGPYDFETLVDRSASGSVKWNLMRDADPDAPPGIVPLSIGDMELRTAPELLDGLKDYLDTTILGYTAPTAEDRRVVVDWFERRHGWAVDPDWLVGIDGVVPGLYLAVQALTKPDAGVIYMPPVYHPIYLAIHDSGRTPIAVPLVIHNGEYEMDFDALEAAMARPEVSIILFCSPHNPVSRIWRRDELTKLGELCQKHGVIMVSDEIHMDFAMPGHRHVVYSQIDPSFADHAVICTAPSKTFNIAGLQTSNLVISNHELRHRIVHTYRSTGRHGVNQLGLAACRLAYERCDDWLDAVTRLIYDNGLMLLEFMAENYPEVVVHDHQGTYFIWLDFRAWGKTPQELERFMVKGARLFLDEGYIFGTEGEGFERFNLACPSWVLRDALDRLLLAGRP